jgi:hypothetical protein
MNVIIRIEITFNFRELVDWYQSAAREKLRTDGRSPSPLLHKRKEKLACHWNKVVRGRFVTK